MLNNKLLNLEKLHTLLKLIVICTPYLFALFVSLGQYRAILGVLLINNPEAGLWPEFRLAFAEGFTRVYLH